MMISHSHLKDSEANFPRDLIALLNCDTNYYLVRSQSDFGAFDRSKYLAIIVRTGELLSCAICVSEFEA